LSALAPGPVFTNVLFVEAPRSQLVPRPWKIYGHFNAPGDEEVEIYYLVR